SRGVFQCAESRQPGQSSFQHRRGHGGPYSFGQRSAHPAVRTQAHLLTMRTLATFLTLAAALGAAEYQYRSPIVFGRGQQDEKTGRYILHSKIWIMDEDGSNQRQITEGPSYDDHPSMYPDLRHVLYSEFTSPEFKTEL